MLSHSVESLILYRLSGKVLACSGALGGPVWSLHLLQFRDRSFLYKKIGVDISVADEMAPIAGLRFPPPDIPLDDGTFVGNPSRPSASSQDPADWPEGYLPETDWPDNPNYEDRNQPVSSWEGGRNDDRSITAIPSQVIIRAYGSSPYKADFDTKKSDSSVNIGIEKIKCTWPDESWLYLRQRWGVGFEKLSSGSMFLLGVWDASDIYDLKMDADVEPDVVFGIQQQTATFQVVDMWGRPLKKSDGSYVTTTLLVIYMSGAPEIEVVTVPPIILNIVGNDLVAAADQTLQFRNIGAGWLYWSLNLVENPPPTWLAGLGLTVNTPTVVQGPMVNGETKDVTIGAVNSLDISVTRPLSPFRSNAVLRGFADAGGVDLLQTEAVEIQLHIRRPPFIFLDTLASDAGFHGSDLWNIGGWVTDSIDGLVHTPLVFIDGEAGDTTKKYAR